MPCTAETPPLRRLSLPRRLTIALCMLVAVLALVLFLVVAPIIRGSFARLSAADANDNQQTLHDLTRQQTGSMRQVLVDLIHHTTTARERALHDLPLDALGGDVAAIRSAVLADDAERSARQRQNVEVLANEMQQRADATIESRLLDLSTAQRERAAQVIADLQWTHLLLVVATLAALLVVLGIGLHRFVVLPTRRLQQATQRIAAGELTVDLPPPGPDELGDLTRAFAKMVEQLRASRGALQQLADNLETEVQKKTQNLEQALTDLRTSHLQLAQAERLASLGTLAGGIAHEFHNVIGGIRGCAHELLTDEADADRRETIAVITRAADRGTNIVHQLLRFARHSCERMQPLDPAALVDDALRLCEPAARRQQVQVERRIPQGLQVDGDADGLHQVLVNLIVNALHAMPNGGMLRVAVERREGEIVIAVADTGVGIDPQHLPHVFEPFFTTRADAADPAQRGSGLGLAVSYGIVAAHGGRIEVASTPGQGATFRIHLPIATSSQATAP